MYLSYITAFVAALLATTANAVIQEHTWESKGSGGTVSI